MSKKELEQLSMLLDKFSNTYNKSYPIMGAVQLLLLDDNVDLPKFTNTRTSVI